VKAGQLSARRWYGRQRELLLVGDSVVEQMWRGVVCELARLAPLETLPPLKGPRSPSADRPKAMFVVHAVEAPSGRVLDSSGAVPTAASDVTTHRGDTSWPERGGMGSHSLATGYHQGGQDLRRRLLVASVGCDEKECSQFGGLKVCYMNMRMSLVSPQMAACLQQASRASDVVALNVGLWHNEPRTLSTAVRRFKQLVEKARAQRGSGGAGGAGKVPKLLWLEMTPQHFNRPGGNFRQGVLRGWKAKGERCMSPAQARRASMDKLEFRNREAFRQLDGLGLPVFRSWAMLRHSPELHVQLSKKRGTPGGKDVDCTHWCEGPAGTSPVAALSLIFLSDVMRSFWSGNSHAVSPGKTNHKVVV